MNAAQLQDTEAQLSQVADQLKIFTTTVHTVTQNLALVLAKLERAAKDLETDKRSPLSRLAQTVGAQVIK